MVKVIAKPGFLISIDLKNSTRIKQEESKRWEDFSPKLAMLYNQHNDTYFQFVEFLVKGNRDLLDRIFLIKNLGDEFWIFIVCDSKESDSYFKIILNALKMIIDFPLEKNDSVNLHYRAFVDYQERVESYSALWIESYKKFIRRILPEKSGKQELDDLLKKSR